jgi:hypothetical protein
MRGRVVLRVMRFVLGATSTMLALAFAVVFLFHC